MYNSQKWMSGAARTALIAAISIGCFTTQAWAQTPTPSIEELPAPRLEVLPDRLQTLIEARQRLLASLPRAENGKSALEITVEQALLWTPGQTVTIAFNGGTPDLHRKIAAAANEWTNYANIKFDFGFNSATGQYRTWSTQDTEYAADIRIGFAQGGYWSQVGNDSSHPNMSRPYWASMNFGGYDRYLPSDYAGTVLHEFGHALAAHHMHQHPRQGCDREWRWQDDQGYVRTHVQNDQNQRLTKDSQGRHPGLYSFLGGPTNFWKEAKVDHNLKQLSNTSAYRSGQFDSQSIMLYAFASWMFKNGENSVCYIGRRPNTLSAQDKLSIAEYYPKGSTRKIAQIIADRDQQISAVFNDTAIKQALTAQGAIEASFLTPRQ